MPWSNAEFQAVINVDWNMKQFEGKNRRENKIDFDFLVLIYSRFRENNLSKGNKIHLSNAKVMTQNSNEKVSISAINSTARK